MQQAVHGFIASLRLHVPVDKHDPTLGGYRFKVMFSQRAEGCRQGSPSFHRSAHKSKSTLASDHSQGGLAYLLLQACPTPERSARQHALLNTPRVHSTRRGLGAPQQPGLPLQPLRQPLLPHPPGLCLMLPLAQDGLHLWRCAIISRLVCLAATLICIWLLVCCWLFCCAQNDLCPDACAGGRICSRVCSAIAVGMPRCCPNAAQEAAPRC